MVVPDGAFTAIPFEVLPYDGSRLLIERYAVSYSPSASFVGAASAKREVRWPWQRAFEAFADPAPGATAQAFLSTRNASWERLPEASREVAGISRILGGRSELRIGGEARKQPLFAADPPPAIDFATHAFVDRQNPDLSYILLAPASAGQRYDFLFLKEIYGLPLGSVQLVTLSACETDAGKSCPVRVSRTSARRSSPPGPVLLLHRYGRSATSQRPS